MYDQLKKVSEFHNKMGQHTRFVPTTYLPEKEQELRIGLIAEEALEFADAARKRDIVEIADALADLLYTTFGAILAYGLGGDIEAIFDAVHDTNMAKTPQSGAENTIHKIVKPEGWVAPTERIKDIITERMISPDGNT